VSAALAVRRLAQLSEEERERLLARSTAAIFDPALVASVQEILLEVRERGDAAVCDALRRFDGVDLEPSDLLVPEDELETARNSLPAELLEAIRLGISNIRAFNERAIADASWQAELTPGLRVGEQARPVASAALFVPAGKGSFPSVLMHVGTPAVVAGVRDLTVLVPPAAGGAGEVDPAVLGVAAELGLRRVVRVNGPAGVGAAAFGTETVPKALMVIGPGSPAVTCAQVQVQAYGCATAMLFGPSESLVVADETADPVLVAADLLNEAEHGTDSSVVLLATSERLAAAVVDAIADQLTELAEPRRAYAEAALRDGGGLFVAESVDEAIAFVNEYAPEHLQLAVADPGLLLPSVEHAGEILLGSTPFAAANYLAGVPNTLPTGRFARLASGVTARTLLKTSSIADVSETALGRLAPGIVALARHEGFPAHAAALERREP
jgi:histidinol dehydrogenase